MGMEELPLPLSEVSVTVAVIFWLGNSVALKHFVQTKEVFNSVNQC